MLTPKTYEDAAKKIAQITTGQTNEGLFLPATVVRRIGKQIRERRLQLGLEPPAIFRLCRRLRGMGKHRLKAIERGTPGKYSVYAYLRLCELLDLDSFSVFRNAIAYAPDTVLERQLESFLSKARHRRTLVRTAWAEELTGGLEDATIRNSRRKLSDGGGDSLE